MASDLEDILGPILEKTIYLWVFPYAIWYFISSFFIWVWDWVTEPEESL